MLRAAAALVPIALIVAACGAESAERSQRGEVKDEVARVGSESVSRAEVEALLDEAAVSFEALRRPFPKKGTPYYLDLRDQALTHLVEQSAHEQEAKRLGTEVDSADVEHDLERVDEEAFREWSEWTGLTMDRVRAVVYEWRLRIALFKAVVSQKAAGESNAEAMKRWERLVDEQIAAAVYVPGWKPAEQLRSPTPPELQDLPRPRIECDLEEGTFTLREVAEHGCIAQMGVGIPGVDGKPCPEIPISDFGIAPFAEDPAYNAYESVLMNTEPSCVGYPETSFTFTAEPSSGPCFGEPCTHEGRERSR